MMKTECQFNKEPNKIIDFLQFSEIYACKNLSILCRVYLLGGGITGKLLWKLNQWTPIKLDSIVLGFIDKRLVFEAGTSRLWGR